MPKYVRQNGSNIWISKFAEFLKENTNTTKSKQKRNFIHLFEKHKKSNVQNILFHNIVKIIGKNTDFFSEE